jgi:hypothetical protein
MKRLLKMYATFFLLGALMVSCVDPQDEPESVVAMRKAKAALAQANTLVKAAGGAYGKATDAYSLAENELRKAEAGLSKVVADKIHVESEYHACVSEYAQREGSSTDLEKAQMQAVIDSLAREVELLKAEIETLVEKQLKLLLDAKTAAFNAGTTYENQLEDLEQWLLAQEILSNDAAKDDLVRIMAEIRILIGEIGKEREKLYYLQAEEYFYKNVDVEQIKAKLNGAVEQAERDLYVTNLAYQAWTEILAYANEKRREALPELQGKITEAEKEKINIDLEIVREKQTLTPLTIAYNTAQNAYNKAVSDRAASTATINIVALNGGTDSFFEFGEAPNALYSQVYGGYYGFYNRIASTVGSGDPGSTPTRTAYPRSELNEKLTATQDYIKKYRLYSGLGGAEQAGEIMKARTKAKNDAAQAYVDELAKWKGLYRTGTQTDPTITLRANWIAAKAQYEHALATYQATYEQGLNPLYKETVKQIERYVEIVKAILAGTAGWAAELNQISNVLGGISFDPTKLTELVFQDNFPLVQQAYTALISLPGLIVIGEYMNTVMSGFYSAAAAYQSGAYVEPVMQKHQNSSFDYHAWFLLYIMFEGNRLYVGDDILVINTEGYSNVVNNLCEDFLGFYSENYPGVYKLMDVNTNFRESAPIATNRIGNGGPTTYPNGTEVKAADFTIPAALLAAEIALNKAWAAWGAIATDLNTSEASMFAPYNRTWRRNNYEVAVKTTISSVDYYKPYWTTDDATTAIVVNDQNPVFYFRPELTMETLQPSLNLGEAVNFGIGKYDYGNSGSEEGQSYNAIYAYRTMQINVSWSSWLAMGYPVYNECPVLWRANITGGMSTWDNNGELPAALYGKALVTARNHQIFDFWYNNQNRYADLITNIETAKTNNNTEINKLNAAIVDKKITRDAAKALMDAQQAVIDDLIDKKAGLNALIGQYEAIMIAIQGGFVSETEKTYLAARAAYYAADDKYKKAVANRDIYNNIGVYFDEFGAPVVAVSQFVSNKLDQIATDRMIIENQIEEYKIRIAALEAQKEALVTQVGVTP